MTRYFGFLPLFYFHQSVRLIALGARFAPGSMLRKLQTEPNYNKSDGSLAVGWFSNGRHHLFLAIFLVPVFPFCAAPSAVPFSWEQQVISSVPRFEDYFLFLFGLAPPQEIKKEKKGNSGIAFPKLKNPKHTKVQRKECEQQQQQQQIPKSPRNLFVYVFAFVWRHGGVS